MAPVFKLAPGVQSYAWGKKGQSSLAAQFSQVSVPDFTIDDNETYAEVSARRGMTCTRGVFVRILLLSLALASCAVQTLEEARSPHRVRHAPALIAEMSHPLPTRSSTRCLMSRRDSSAGTARLQDPSMSSALLSDTSARHVLRATY